MKGTVTWCSEKKVSKAGHEYYSFAVKTDVGSGFGVAFEECAKGDVVEGLWDFGGQRPSFRLSKNL